MKCLYSRTSTNGRWGVEIVGTPLPQGQEWKAIMPGAVEALGTEAGMTCFKYNPDTSGFVVTCEDVEVIPGSGAIEVLKMGLQSSSYCTLLHCQEGAIIKSFGYKGRDSSYSTVTPTGLKEVPASVLLALGIIQPKEPAVVVQQAQAPNAAMVAALKKAGLVS